MTATFIRNIQQVGTMALVNIGDVVPAGKMRRLDLRAANIAAGSDANADVYVYDGANSGYRCKTYPVPFNQIGSTPDLEFGLLLAGGQRLQIRASAEDKIAFSLSQSEDVAGTLLPTLQQVATDSLVSFGTVVPAGKVRRVDLRACNISAGVDSLADVLISDGSNSGYLTKSHPVPFNQPGSAPDVVYDLKLFAGQQLQIRGGHLTAVSFSMIQVEDDA